MILQNDLISPKQLRHIVSERLRDAILDGDLKPGEWLRQKRIAQDLGVSQMPVREAFKELAAEGLIEHVPYRGVRVIEFSAQDVADLYAHRSFLEGMAARAAAENISSQELGKLHDILRQMQENLSPDSLAEYRRLNRLFHQSVCAASKRSYLIRTLNQMWATFPTMLCGNFAQTAVHPLPERNDNDLQEHTAIVQALQNKDGDLAQELSQRHIDEAGKQLLAVLNSA